MPNLDLNGPLTEELMQRYMEAQPQAEPKEGIGKLAPAIWLGGGAADVASTIHGMKNGMQEANPLVNWAPKGAQIPIGIGMELGGVLLAKKLLGDKHPGVMKALMMGLGGIHGGLAIKNLHSTSLAKQPVPEIQVPDNSPNEYRNYELYPETNK